MCRWFFVVTCLAASLNTVEAASVRNAFRVTTWSGGAYSDDQTKAFERCAATKPGTAGTDISYSVDRQFRWRATLSNPAWNFIKGAEQNVRLTIGEANGLIHASAVAIGRTVLELQTNDPILFFAQLRIARQLRVIVGGLVLGFSLDGGEEVLSALTQCVLRSTRYYQSAKSTSSIFDSYKAASKSAIQTEATALVSKIIAYARVADSRMLTATEDISSFPIDAAWKVGLIMAGVTILEAPLPSERIVEAIIVRSLLACHGGFFFISLSDTINRAPIARIFVSCQTTETTTSSYQLVIPRPKAGHYVLSVVSTGSSFIGIAHRTADAYEARLRAIIMLAISNLH